jgi:hypothetical protein
MVAPYSREGAVSSICLVPVVAIPHIEPQHAVITQHPAHLLKHRAEISQILTNASLKTDLTVLTIIPELVIWWGCDHTVHGIIRQGLEVLNGVAAVDGVEGHRFTNSPASFMSNSSSH